MGRSKFPGKPSKSINRKRISVLQIDDEGLAEQQENAADVPTNRNNRNNNNDDDDNENDTRNGSSSNNGRVADGGSTDGGSGSQNNQNVNGKNSEDGKSSNGDSGCAGNSNNVAESNSESSNKDASDAQHLSAIETSTMTKPLTVTTTPLGDESGDERSGDKFPETIKSKKKEKEDEKSAKDNNGNNAISTNKIPLQSLTTIPSTYAEISTTTAVASNGKTCNRKFKNLNLAKPDIIIPSSPKVKQQQQIKSDSSSSTAKPFATESKAYLETDADEDSMDNYSTTLLGKTVDFKIENKTSDISLESSKTSTDTKNVCAYKLMVNDNTNSHNSLSNNSTSSSISKLTTTTKQKKTVTFKNILETSDDKSAVKKMYNPDNRRPLVSIMKKECIYRPMLYTRNSECIVRPSRLTEILKNNSNIDKLNSLKFRSSTTTSCVSSPNMASNESSTLNSLFGAGLSRAFGAPTTNEDMMYSRVTFRTKPVSLTRDSNTDIISNDNNDASKHKDDEELNKGGIETNNRNFHIDGDGDKIDDDEDEQQMIVDKLFVLPKRSTRSSRVIKPNKRLLEDGIICKKSANKTKLNASNMQKNDPSNYFFLREDCDNTKLNLGNNVSKELPDQKAIFSLSASQFPKYNLLKANSFVLRQPRLQVYESVSDRMNTSQSTSTSPTSKSVTSKSLTHSVCSNTPLNSTSTFSLSATNSSLNSASLSNSTSCNVCSTIIINKNVQEARKYGVLACEACRKFISKINKKSIASSGSSSKKHLQLICKGDGNCNILSQSKNLIKNFKKIYKERCSACWLKKCIQIFHFPSGHKLRLSSILPVNVIKQKDSLIQIATTDTCLRNDTELLSPTGLFLPQRITSAGQIKWKSSVDIGVEMKINLKNNLLAENIVTFGSSPLLRPPILEKSIFTKSIEQQKVDKVKKLENSDIITEDDSIKNQNKINENGHKSIKSKRKEKLEKEKDKDLLNKLTTNTSKYSSKGVMSEIINASITNSENTLLSTTQTIPVTLTQSAVDFLGPTSTVTSTLSYSSISALTTTTASASTLADTHKRQRIDLKGPRVKHVCRSASIVLGQPLAIFDEENAMNSNQHHIDESLASPTKITDITSCRDENYTNGHNTVSEENEKCSSCRFETSSKSLCTTESATKQTDEIIQPRPSKFSNLSDQKMTQEMNSENVSVLNPTKIETRNIYSNCNNITINNYNTLSVQKSNEMFPSVVGKKYINLQQHHQHNLQKRKESTKAKLLISIDFWENYDPAEVSQTGFGLIITETVAQRALCFLCGSTGLDSLIFCACCCEPYHQYCVLDEYNLKHSSLDDTIASVLDMPALMNDTNTNNINQITNRLNWLCPRCTVCYTCNMSSGSKVKCQKCQKNYHSTCLGTSKRLLGADRPLICVNCLKCKSCSTTKVSKFVGNLPMCTSCFKLRKKGNYCPICQKCYEENDFDLKMMECGNCNQWVHSKCEGLTDEQYNLLSTLPESIEFICIKCAKQTEHSKQKAHEWRQAVTEEFKTSLMSVLKLLSKSRQACALLKLSPRKKIICICGGNGKIQPKCLQFNTERDPLGSDGESQCSEDIYEFNENIIEDKAKEKCICLNTLNLYYGNQTNNLSLVDIKRKIISNEYVSLAEFNYDMNNVIQIANCDELVIAYKEILSEQFPWFQNETKACTDALEEDMFESCSYIINNSLESQNFNNEIHSRLIIDLPENIDNLIYSLKIRKDMRVCLFCRKIGEAESNKESRLLYCGHDCWVHTNCAMWSAEVFEEIDGSLQNVHSAVSRGRKIRCTVCGNRGATVGCNVKSCGEHYHFPCARSISCSFLVDKTVYCPDHAEDAPKGKVLAASETNFDVTRPVYVELDRKRNKLIEPSKVQFHIGSLEVKQLGTVIPRFSDTYEAIIPINFLCSRLYWSSKEPWKIVEYTIKTTIQNSFSTLTAFDAGRNFTIDHTNPNSSMVQLGLAQISLWHNSLARGNIVDFEASDIVNLRNSTLTKLLPEFLSNNQNSSSATDENTEEEPQNNADLFPPEIKDAIFEDLPHELLDGISMLDIFPKFMICEEMGNSDGKTEMFLNEQSKDSTPNTVTNSNVHISDDDTVNSAFSKQTELNNSWSSNNLIVNHVEDALLSSTRSINQIKRNFNSGDIQRNKSELLKRTPQQRTWPKIDGNSAAIKRRKFSKNLQEMRVTEGVLFSINQQRNKKEAVTLQAVSRRQSQSNDVEMNNTLRTKQFIWSAAKHIETKLNIERDDKIKLMQVDGVDDSITEYRIYSTDSQFNGTVRCDRCHCTYRTYESFQRHLTNCEPLSTSESESETTSRTPESAACQMMSSDAINELNKLNQGHRTSTLANVPGNLPFIQTFPQAVPINNIQTSINSIPLTNMSNIQSVQGLQNIQGLQNLQSLQNIQIQNIQPQAIGSNFFISHSNPTTSNSDELQFFSNSLQGLTSNLHGTYTIAPTTTFGAAAIQPAQQQQTQLIAVSTNPDGSQQIIQLPSVNTQNSQILQTAGAFQTLQPNNDKKIMLPVGSKSIKTLGIKGNQQLASTLKGKIKSNNVIKPMQTKVSVQNTTVPQQTIQTQQTPITLLNTGGVAPNTAQLLSNSIMQQMQAASISSSASQPQILFQTANATTQQQPIIMQQVGTATNSTVPQNIISFVTTDGTQTPQVQYLSLPQSSDFKTQTQTAPFITAANANPPIMQGAFIQTDASGNLVLTTSQAPAGLQMLSATPVNITQTTQPQSQVIGTLIQPQTIQLGGNVITTADPPQQQVILGGGANGLEMLAAANAAAPQVILATQPMYYGLETIVQNTVMSSQQFVSTAMPGVLSQNASFSATTTQVFQASKIEPIVDIPTGYVVLNNVDTGASIVQQPGPHQTNYLSSTTNVLQQPQPNHNTHQSTTSEEAQNNIVTDQQHSIYRIQTPSDNNSNFSCHNQQQQQFMEQTVNQQQPAVQIVTAKVPPVSQIKRNTGKATPIAAVTKVQPQIINKVVPTTNNKLNNKQISQHSRISSQIIVDAEHIATAQAQMKTSINANFNNCNTLKAHQNVDTQQIFTAPCVTTVPATIATKPLQIAATTKKTNFIRPIHKAEVKPKIMKNTTISKPNLQRQTIQQQQQQQQQLIQSVNDNSKTIFLKSIQDSQNTQQTEINTVETNKSLEFKPVSNQEYQQLNEFRNHEEEYRFAVTVQNPAETQIQNHLKPINDNIINNSYEFSQQQQHNECQTMQQQKCYNIDIIKDQTEIFNQHQQDMNAITNNSISQNRSQYCNSVFNANVPTNIVNPLQQNTQYTAAITIANNIHQNSTTLISRPTNRVLPMQQTPNQTTTAETVKTVAKTINDVSKLYNDVTSKVCYESEVKKDEDVILQIEINSPHLQSQHQIFQLNEQDENGTFNKSLSVTEFVDNTLKCDLEAMENETALTTQQIEIVANDLQDYAANCLLISEKDKIASTIVSQNFNEIDCTTGSEIMNGIEQDDDDDDGFSIKMPTEEMSDSDEPAVKAKISKILDNLTNEDCNDSITTVATVETCAELGTVKYINGQICENALQSAAEKSKFDNENVSETIAVTANNFMTQIENEVNVEISRQIDDTNFNMKKMQTKLSSHVKLDKVPATIIDNVSNIPITPATKMDDVNSLKTETQFPPSYPNREPKKITGPHLLYEIQSDDGFTYKSTSITEIWEQVFEAVQVARRAHGLVPLPEGPLADMCGVQMIGLKTNALKYLIEQLPGVEKCQKYTPKYHKYDPLLSQSVALSTVSTISSISGNGISSANINSTVDYSSDQEDLQENLFGCARLEPFSKRSEYDMFSWLASRHRKQPIQVFLQPSDNELIPRRGTGSNLPMAMKYRTLKETYKDYVGVFRSHIHGRGLYCTKDIEAGEMVIEYAGELIRSTLTDKRERCYNSRGIGCYMFKIDENLVVDATMRGNAARFINHSCEPNCYSKVVDILGHKHIIIFALRRIVQGEELTYDYKFPFEDEKIPCSCGSKKCRKYLN